MSRNYIKNLKLTHLDCKLHSRYIKIFLNPNFNNTCKLVHIVECQLYILNLNSIFSVLNGTTIFLKNRTSLLTLPSPNHLNLFNSFPRLWAHHNINPSKCFKTFTIWALLKWTKSKIRVLFKNNLNSKFNNKTTISNRKHSWKVNRLTMSK